MLLDPGVVFQVVDSAAFGIRQLEHVVGGLAVQVAGEICGGVALAVFAEFLVHFMQAGAVEFHRVGQHGDQDVVFVHFVILGGLDAGEHVRDAREAKQIEIGD